MSDSLSVTTADSAVPPACPKAAQNDFSAAPMPTVRRTLEVLGWVVVAWLVIVGLTSIVGRAGFLAGALELAPADPEGALGPFDYRYYEHAVATTLHLIPALAIMLLGPLQFIRGIRTKYIKFHRLSGYIFMVCGVIGALSGIILGVFNPFMGVSGQGFNESMATTFFSGYTLFALFMAFDRIRKRMIPQHREWMIRSWALMLAVTTERTLLIILQITTEIDIAVLFGTTFWMAGVVNLVAAESWINLTRTPGKGTRHWKDADARALAR
jgi:uncharacterized membrane protein